jgi:hypothetical protein
MLEGLLSWATYPITFTGCIEVLLSPETKGPFCNFVLLGSVSRDRERVGDYEDAQLRETKENNWI